MPDTNPTSSLDNTQETKLGGSLDRRHNYSKGSSTRQLSNLQKYANLQPKHATSHRRNASTRLFKTLPQPSPQRSPKSTTPQQIDVKEDSAYKLGKGRKQL